MADPYFYYDTAGGIFFPKWISGIFRVFELLVLRGKIWCKSIQKEHRVLWKSCNLCCGTVIFVRCCWLTRRRCNRAPGSLWRIQKTYSKKCRRGESNSHILTDTRP